MYPYRHILNGSKPEWTVDWGYDTNPRDNMPTEKTCYLGFSSEDNIKKFIDQYGHLIGPCRIYKGIPKLRPGFTVASLSYL
jgi:hypothetical protein